MESSDHHKAGGQKPLGNTGKIFDNQSLNDSLTSLYTPPYSSSAQNYFNRKREEGAQEDYTQKAYNFDSLSQPSDYAKKMQAMNKPFEEKKNEFHYVPPQPIQENVLPREQIEVDAEERKNGFISIFALSVGTNLAILGLLQLLFAQGGKLTLEWDASHWFFYLVPAIPLLFFGYRKLKSL
jgi:hypothetical protein